MTGKRDGLLSTESKTVRVPLGLLHLRPSARLAKVACSFGSEIVFEFRGQKCNAKELTSIISLGLLEGGALTIFAHGKDAQQAIESLSALLMSSEFRSMGHVPADTEIG